MNKSIIPRKTSFLSGPDIASGSSVRGQYVLKDDKWHRVTNVSLIDRNNIRLSLHSGEKLMMTAFGTHEFMYNPPHKDIAVPPKVRAYIPAEKVPGPVVEGIKLLLGEENVIVCHDKRMTDIYLKTEETETEGDPLSFGVQQPPYFKSDHQYEKGDSLFINNLYYECKGAHVSPKSMFDITDAYLRTYWGAL